MSEKRRKRQRIEMQVNREIYELIKHAAQQGNKSVNRYIIDLVTEKLSTKLQEEHEIKEEYGNHSKEKKVVEYRIRFTESEGDRIKQYAQENSWSVPKEIRYRVIGTMQDTGKISPEELVLLRGIKVSINAVGNNINRIIREDRVMDQIGVEACTILSNNIVKVRSLIMQIYEKSKARFSLKKVK
ncbi:hypothetical protein [Candidatus Tisiphia endosymbiont of Beris chalybata]|uniref:hypothetical protein n=1 Tax=Candidatus Tisiphia endosymbiont of Beris chalybata TaxID=3066262 RepID=UPI00312CBB18